eukprot:m.200759 g.200759  ORF g.200759 m.200759 type:complete len:535 (-) comp32774_c0_seq2:347-1951(-)
MSKMSSFAVTLLVLSMTVVTASQPMISVDGFNVNIETDGGVFQVDGEKIAFAGDISAAISNLRHDTTALVAGVSVNVANLQTDLATKIALTAVKDAAATQEFVKQSVQDLNATLKQLKDSVATVDQLNTVNRSFILGMGELSEVNEALQENMETLFGWRGIVVFDNCTVLNCTIGIHGKGFFPSTTALNGQVVDLGGAYSYKVTVNPESTSTNVDCTVLSVTEGFVFANCGGVITDPPSAKFWSTVKITENDNKVPFTGDTDEPTKLQFTTTKATVYTVLTSYSFVTSLSPDLLTAPVTVNFTSHDHTSPTFSSSDQSVVKDSGIKFTKASDGSDSGVFTVQFLKAGSITVTITTLDTLDQATNHKVTFSMTNEFTCNEPLGAFKADACVQNPIDQAWGKGSSDCMKLQDSNFGWTPLSGSHVSMNSNTGYAELTWKPKTLYAAHITQKAGGWDGQKDVFAVYVKVAEADSAEFGKWVLVKTCANGGCSIANGKTAIEIPKEYRRTSGFKIQRVGALAAADSIRITEIFFQGCA